MFPDCFLSSTYRSQRRQFRREKSASFTILLYSLTLLHFCFSPKGWRDLGHCRPLHIYICMYIKILDILHIEVNFLRLYIYIYTEVMQTHSLLLDDLQIYCTFTVLKNWEWGTNNVFEIIHFCVHIIYVGMNVCACIYLCMCTHNKPQIKTKCVHVGL